MSGHKSEEHKAFIQKLLSEPNTASNICIVIDGLDEKSIPDSSDIFKLIVGQLYPHVKVIFTCRPEAGILAEISKKKKASYIISIKGTTKEGVYQYLTAILSAGDNKPTKEQIDTLIKTCEEQMTDFHMLQVPLYLTLIGYVFSDYWKRELTFQHFMVPDTVTKLFNIFITVLIRAWLERIDRKTEADQLRFDKNPVEKHSTVPRDIKLLLVSYGKLSFDFLMKQTYSFSDDDLDDYLLDKKSVVESGMFCGDQHGSVFFFRHKQLQEYLAAVFVSYEKFNNSLFSNMIDQGMDKADTSLKDIFTDIQLVIYFLFGLSPEFGVEILKKLKGQVCVVTGYGGINLNYESKLCSEACDKEVTEMMGQLLLSSNTVKNDDYEFYCPVSTVYNLCDGLTTPQCVTLLQKWTGLYVSNTGGDHWYITHTGHSVSDSDDVSDGVSDSISVSDGDSDDVSHSDDVSDSDGVSHSVSDSISVSHSDGVSHSVSATVWCIRNIFCCKMNSNTDTDSPCQVRTENVPNAQPNVSHSVSVSHCATNPDTVPDTDSPVCVYSRSTSHVIIDNVPNIQPNPSTSRVTGTISPSGTLRIRKLDTVIYFLLTNFTFPDIRTLHVKWSYMIHPGLIQRVFTGLHTLVLEEADSDLDEDMVKVMSSSVRQSDSHSTTLTHLTVTGDCVPLPVCTVSSLLTLSHLHTLRLSHTDMLTRLSNVTCDIQWSQLHTLEMCLWRLDDENSETQWSALTVLLRHTPNLTVLAFGCEFNQTTPGTQTDLIPPVLQTLATLPHLTILMLLNILHPPVLKLLCQNLHNMKQVSTLGLGLWDIRGDLDYKSDSVECDSENITVLSQTLRSVTHISHLRVVYRERWSGEAEGVLRSLTQCPPHVTMSTYHWDLAH